MESLALNIPEKFGAARRFAMREAAIKFKKAVLGMEARLTSEASSTMLSKSIPSFSAHCLGRESLSLCSGQRAPLIVAGGPHNWLLRHEG